MILLAVNKYFNHSIVHTVFVRSMESMVLRFDIVIFQADIFAVCENFRKAQTAWFYDVWKQAK